MKRTLSAVLLLGSLFLVPAPAARAQITINFVYDGTKTTLTYNVAPGSLSSLTFSGSTATADEHNVRSGGLVNVTAATMDTYVNPGFANANWGTPTVAATSFSGDSIRFFVGSSGVRVPAGFDRSTGTLAGTLEWNGLALVDLGFASNATTSGSFAALGTMVNWTATTSAIPEPGTYAAMLLGCAVLYVARRRTKRS